MLLKGWHHCEEKGEDFFPFVILDMCGGFIGGAITLISGSTALLVWFAPKVWLLKEIATLLK